MAVCFSEAAQRFWRDAEALSGDTRLGTPDHLYGIAAECALKAILIGLGAFALVTAKPPRPWGVHIDKLWDQYTTYLAGLSGRTALIPTAPNPFNLWRVDHRYEEDASFTESRLKLHQQGARLAMSVLEQARISGIIK